jgi:hypothetical protein
MHDACVTRGIMLMKVILDFREVGLCEFSLMGNVSVITIAFFFFGGGFCGAALRE